MLWALSFVICAGKQRSVHGGQRGLGLLNLVLGAASAGRKGWGGRELLWTFTQVACSMGPGVILQATGSIQELH